MNEFGKYLREQREARRANDPSYSLRQFAERVGMPASWLSRIERGDAPPPAEEHMRSIARELDEDPDLLMARAGRIAEDLQTKIQRHPDTFAEFAKWMRTAPEHAILRVVREVRDGDW